MKRSQEKIVAVPYLLIGTLLFCTGISVYLFGVLLVFPRYLLDLNKYKYIDEKIVWYSGMPIVLGLAFMLVDLLLLFRLKKPVQKVRFDPIAVRKVTVALTAYNDEESIGPSVQDFLAHPSVSRVIVVSNNSVDLTAERAAAAGAIVVNELSPGYGRCVYRCFQEAMSYTDTDLIILSEGDMTFRGSDIDKFLAYAPHADIVNGTRTVESLRERHTQLSTFMYYGNLFVGKLLEAKYLGKATITDVGTTYKLCRRNALDLLMPLLDPSVNLEFNAYFLDTVMKNNLTIVECPITFHPRVGKSKGGNVNNIRALKVGCRMVSGILFGWKRLSNNG